jgi:hypothetical protein
MLRWGATRPERLARELGPRVGELSPAVRHRLMDALTEQELNYILGETENT